VWTQFSANFSSPVTTVVFFLHGRGKGSSFIKGNLHPTLRLIWRVESFSCICCFSMNSTQKDSIVRDSRCVCGGGRGWHTFWFTSQGRPGLPATTRSQKIVVEWILPQGPKRNQLSSHLDLRVWLPTREWTCVLLSHHVCGDFLQKPQDLGLGWDEATTWGLFVGFSFKPCGGFVLGRSFLRVSVWRTWPSRDQGRAGRLPLT
jgi:hypothetical protein